MSTPKRYHPLLVSLHWLIAALILFMLFLGFTQLGSTPNDNAKIQTLGLHMPIGIALFVLTIIRLAVRFFTPKPEPASAGNPILDKIGVAVHYLLYIVVLAMGLTGMGTSALAGLPAIVFEGSGSLPADFAEFPPAIGHGFFSYVLSGLVFLHVGAALFHQFIRRDNLLSRMWFGRGE
jgi:cytochrome b561